MERLLAMLRTKAQNTPVTAFRFAALKPSSMAPHARSHFSSLGLKSAWYSHTDASSTITAEDKGSFSRFSLVCGSSSSAFASCAL